LRTPEKVYEDWLVENIDVFGHEARLVSRQKGLPSGRQPDLLVLNVDGLCVVEVKAIRATERAVLQLLRYVGEIKSDMKCPLPVHGVLAAPDISNPALCALRGANIEYLRLSPQISAEWDHSYAYDCPANGVVLDALRGSLPSGTRPTLGALVGPARGVAFRPVLSVFDHVDL
jgi:RecB family endonuclease NucS